MTKTFEKSTVQKILESTNIAEKQELLIADLINDVPHVNPFLYGADSYKVSHIRFETDGVKEIYSNFTPRFSKYLEQLLGASFNGLYLVFGIQWMLLRLHVMAKTGFFDQPKDVVIEKMRRVHGSYIGNEDFAHFEALHDLGYLPIKVKTLDEGTTAPFGVPFLTIRNTLPEFEWLPNFLETIISTELWKQMTVATVATAFKRISIEAALKTMGSIDGIEWQNHDFHVRGASGFESAAINGAGFLVSSCGTDNLPALWAAEKFYMSTNDEGLLAGSVAAGEHSVTTSGILTEQERAAVQDRAVEKQIDEVEAEREIIIEKVQAMGITLTYAEQLYAKRVLTEKFPTGIVAYVADSFDFWAFVSIIVPRLKKEILARDGKFVVRGDSGNPVDVITGLPDVNLIEQVAKDFMAEALIGNTFTVKDQKYLVVSKPKALPANKYLPLFELERQGHIVAYDFAEVVKSHEINVSSVINAREATKDILNNYFAELNAEREAAEDKDSVKVDQIYVDSMDAQIATYDVALEALENAYPQEPDHTVISAEAKGTIEVLWEIFGGTITEKGYKLLDSHIGMIYGDGITVQRSQQIFSRLAAKGFASLNIVYGVGSYSLNMLSRDHMGMAIKATNTIVDIHGELVDKPIYKDPKTDTSKKSARGLIKVFKGEDGVITYVDNQDRENEDQGLLTVAYEDGQFKKLTTIFEIRDRLWS